MTKNDYLGKPFDSIESAQEFVQLLGQSITEAKDEVQLQITCPSEFGSVRREEAFQLVLYKLENLSLCMAKSQRILNDLRTLRRLLLEGSGASAGFQEPRKP